MSLAAVGSGQHYNIPGGAPPGGGDLALYFRYLINQVAGVLAVLMVWSK